MLRASGLELRWRECANGERCRSATASLAMAARDFAQDDTFFARSIQFAFDGAGSLEEDQEGEEEEPEDAHCVPVPGGAVDQDLAGFELAGDVEAGEGGDEGCDAEEEVDAWTPVMR